MANRKYLIRKCCEYSLLVDAPNKQEALAEAEAEPLDHWEAAWSETSIERDRGEEELEARDAPG